MKEIINNLLQNKNFLMFAVTVSYVLGLFAYFTDKPVLFGGIITLFALFLILKEISYKVVIVWVSIFYFGFCNANFRIKGFDELFKLAPANAVLTAAGKPELKYFDENNTDCYQVDLGGAWSAQAAKDYMDTNLVSFNEGNGNMIELVICNNDGMAEGVIASLQGKGYNKDGGHVVPVFGVDATENAKALIADGAMTGTVKHDAEGMASAIAQSVQGISDGKAPVDALAALNDSRFSIASDCSQKLFVAYAPYTGQ